MTGKGHEIHAFSDEPNVVIDTSNPLLVDRTQLPDSVAAREIGNCDVYTGPVLKYYAMAKKAGIRAVAILGPTLKAEGVKATLPCVGCIDTMENRLDCFWHDEICQYHVTPNDLIKEIS